MEDSFSSNSQLFYFKLERLGLFNSRSETNIFPRRACRNKQRLIPLTSEIQKAMVDFNGSPSASNILEKPMPTTMSLMSLLRVEILKNLFSDALSKVDVDEIIDKYLREKVTIIQNSDNKAQYSEDSNEFEVIVEEMLDEKDKNNNIVEKVDTLENRIAALEACFSSMSQTIEKLRQIQAEKLKINVDAIKEINALQIKDAPIKMEKLQEQCTLVEDIYSKKVAPSNIYEDFFHAAREYALNLFNYKKSLVTIDLNRKPRGNLYIKPVYNVSVPLEH